MTKKIIFILLFLYMQNYAQQFNRVQLDSIYNLYTFLRGEKTSDILQKQMEVDPAIRKCGMTLVNEIKNNLSLFSIEQQTVLAKLLQRRDDLPNTLISPKGFFKIHYTNTGTDAIAYDVNLLAQALDSAYSFEVNYLGYPPPPPDGSAGGDDRYDVYIRNLGDLYGQTISETKVGISNWTSYLEMDNDFPWYLNATPPKQPIDAARVTAAHEFHHAIQMGNYAPQDVSDQAFRSSDSYFYELTSTSMEDFVFNSVNDYYAYMPDYFRNPDRPMPQNNGYNMAIWNIYLRYIFDFDIIKRQWELMPTKAALSAINQSIIERGSSFGYQLNNFGIWTYFTNNRSISGKYFPEASNYPLITPTSTVNFSSPQQDLSMSIDPIANYFLSVNLLSNDGNFTAIITNSDVPSAVAVTNNVYPTFPFSFSIYGNSTDGKKTLSSKYSVTFSREDQTYWNNSGILNNIIAYTDSSFPTPNIEQEAFSYPSPYRYSQNNGIDLNIAFQSDGNSNNDPDFNVYTVDMQQVYSGKASIQKSYVKNSKHYFAFSWDALDNNKKHLASGVYIFIIKIDSDIIKGKLVIFND